MSGASVDWEVRVPERASGPARSRRATLTVGAASGSPEHESLPVAVGRRLLAAQGAPAASRAELDELVGRASLACARARLAELLGRRDYTTLELSERLLDEGYAPAAAREAVEWARSCGLADDARYGAAFARAKALAGWGRLRVERELERRGVSAESIEGWPEEFFDEGSERDRALALASRRRLTGRGDYQRIARFLCGRGYSVGIAADVAREVVDAASGRSV